MGEGGWQVGEGEMSDDFSEYPPSVGEIKAHKLADGTAWTPRDALIDTLRLIDRGEIDPTALIISYQVRNGMGLVAAHNVVSGPDRHTALGLLAASADLLQAARQ